MIRALVIKELRESAALLAVATLPAAWALYVSTGGWPGGRGEAWIVPFGYDDFHYGVLAHLVGGFAIVLGLKQTVWEDARGTYHYLLHRPVDRGRVFLIKALVGLGLVQGLGAAMILIYAAWAATPGTHASPFFWSMTVPAWHVWSVLPLIYLGALLSGLRPARWYGSRLLPLAGCGILAAVLGMQPWPWIAAVGVAAVSALVVASILLVGRTRDY